MVVELLTGELPFRGITRMLVVQILKDEPPAPRKLDGNVPRNLETVCLKSMAKEPRRRYATANEMADDLQRFMRGEPVKARPVGLGARFWLWCQRAQRIREAGFMMTLMAVVHSLW